MNDALIVICSRRDSSRIPRKAFKMIGRRFALDHILKRIENCGIPVVLAVPPSDADYYSGFERELVSMYLGEPNSPLHRMANCLKGTLPKYVIRITHDDILIDTKTMLDLVDAVDKAGAGYGITPEIVEGAGVEVIHTANLFYAAEHIKNPVEHISYFVKGEGLPNPKIVKMRPRESICRNYRLSLDYPEDAIVLENIFREVGVDATNDKICEYLDRNHSILRYNKLPTVSVYTCAFNAEGFISNTTEAVLDALSEVNGEYVFVDDGSTDGTLRHVLKAFADRPRDRFRVIVNEENVGLASSSNTAIANCRGKYVLRVDADDYIKPDMIKRLIENASSTGAGIVYSNYSMTDKNLNVIRERCDPKEFHHAGCALMDKSILNYLRFREGLRHWDSLDLYKRLEEGKFKISYYTKEPLWFYRQHGGNMSASNKEERQRILKEVAGK